MKSLRVAILTHSTNPRGGVVHALALGEALARLGHEAVVHAPDARGAGFFRSATCGTLPVATSPAGPTMHELIEARITDYITHFEHPAHRRFDIYHAGDGISGNALATLRERGLIAGFARTVHHVDTFADPRIARLQRRSIVEAAGHFVVSRLWRDIVARDFGLDATIVGNGVDRDSFSPHRNGHEAELGARLGLGGGPVFLAVGGIEERKNTLNILRAFVQVLAVHPDAQLVVAGGASLLDHGAYQTAFRAELDRSLKAADQVIVTGPIDQADMPALYRRADALVFPSVKEGFGLVALEAIACGTPVVTSRIAPFTEHFGNDDVVWCDPHHVATIADAMTLVLQPETRARLAARAKAALAPHDWRRTAKAHLPIYEQIKEVEHA